MSCEKCEDIVERTDIPHVIRQCKGCGRELHIYESGDHGIGIAVKKGDQFVIPANWFKLSLDPTKSVGHLTLKGLSWFAELIFLDNLPNRKDQIKEELMRMETECDSVLKKSPLLEGLSLDNKQDADQIVRLLKSQRNSAEWWSFLTGTFVSVVGNALDKNEIEQAIWAMACAERCRAMSIFKEHLEHVVWMGHSAKRIVDLLKIWDTNKENSDEEFWQTIFNENSYAISQVFAIPLVFIKEKAYVGGMNLDRQDAKFVDYLFSTESSREAVLVEIKTPVTKLLGSRYRGIYTPSAELSGSIVQVLDYRSSLRDNLKAIIQGTSHNIEAFNPKCVVIVGNQEAQLTSEVRRKAFELFRANSRDVEVVTYDELFRKIEVLANLFSLVRQHKADA